MTCKVIELLGGIKAALQNDMTLSITKSILFDKNP